MRMYVEILDPVPPGIGSSYGGLKFAKYGVCTWVYDDGFCGEVEFINFRKFVSESKYAKPTEFRFWFYPEIIAEVYPALVIRTDMQSVVLNGNFINPATGEGFPLVLP